MTRAAVRANTTIYTIDPRGLVAGPDLDQNVDRMEFLDLRAHAAGQPARARRSDRRPRRRQPATTSRKALKRIDQETSDYYLVGYYSSNPDPVKKRRTIEVKVKRPGAVVWHRPSIRAGTGRGCGLGVSARSCASANGASAAHIHGARSIAGRLRSTSSSVVAHEETLIRIAARPCQTVPPHQQVPSRLDRGDHARVVLGVAERHQHLVAARRRSAPRSRRRAGLGEARAHAGSVRSISSARPARPSERSAAQTSTPRARRDISGV